MSSDIHIKCLNWLSCLYKIFLRQISLSHISIMSCNFTVVRAGYLCRLRCNQFYSLIPMTCLNSSFYSFCNAICLHIMLNSSLHVFLLHKIVSVLFFKRYNMLREMMTSKINCFSVSIASHVRIQGSLREIHPFKKFSRFFIHFISS